MQKAHFHIMCRAPERFIAFISFSCQWILSDSVQIVLFLSKSPQVFICV